MNNESKALVIVPRTIDECVSLAERLSKATTIAMELRDKPANVLATIMAGQELGLSPMASLRGIHIINGIPKLSADTMVAVVLASGKAQYFKPVPGKVTDTSVTYVTKRVGDPEEHSCTWTIDDAKRAALHTKDNWRTTPRQMLTARAKSELARAVYPDILAGVYADEEPIADELAPRELRPDPRHTDVVDAEIVSESPAAAPIAPPAVAPIDAPELAAIDKATTMAELTALAPTFAKLPAPLKTEARKRYGARLAWLEQQPAPTANGAAS